jgi:ribose transport system substrate-binding protein
MTRTAWFCALTLAFAWTGCGKEQPTPNPPVSTPSASAGTVAPGAAAAPAAAVTLAALDAVTKANKPYKIVLIVKTRNNPFFQPMINEFEATAKALGVTADVQAPPEEMDKEQQFALVQTEVGKKVDAICIAPADSKGIVPALKAAQDAGVLVVNLDNRVDKATADSQGLTLGGYVGADNEAGGKLAGEAMLKALIVLDRARNDVIRVAILEGIRGADNAEARKRGFTAALHGGAHIDASETAEWDTDKAYKKTQNILAAHGGITGIFCANDKMAIGAMKAIAEAGATGKIVVVGYDDIPDVKPALASGAMTATIEQHPDLMGRYGLKMAVGILNGSVAKGGDIEVPLETVTKK